MFPRALLLGVLLAACGPAAETKSVAAQAPEPSAAPLVDTLFEGGTCYLATFDAAALAAREGQTVVTFLVVDPGADVRALDTEERKHVGFAFQIAEDADIYTGYGACTRAPGAASCYIEGDGGEFALTPTDAGLRVAITRMEVEGPERISPDLAAAPANRTLDLARGSGADCMID